MAKNKDIKVQCLYEELEELRYYIGCLLKDQESCQEDLEYLHSFISYKGLEEEYIYFRENAHEEYDEELPFPTLTL